MNNANGHASDSPRPAGSERPRYGPDDVVVGDWVWGVRAWLVHPVIRVNRHTVTVGIHRDQGAWLTVEHLRWQDIRGVIPAVPDLPNLPADLAHTLTQASRRLHHGFLDSQQRGALAVLIQAAASTILPTPVTAILFAAITALTHPPRHHRSHDA